MWKPESCLAALRRPKIANRPCPLLGSFENWLGIFSWFEKVHAKGTSRGLTEVLHQAASSADVAHFLLTAATELTGRVI